MLVNKIALSSLNEENTELNNAQIGDKTADKMSENWRF